MEKHRLRVVSYNIHKGFTSGNTKFILKRIREAIQFVHPDLVMLQEVLGHHEGHKQNIEDWPSEPQFEYLADQLWPHFAYGRNAVYSSGHHGNAILSKYPFTFFENIDVSTNRLEKRGLLHGIIELPGRQRPLHAICVHLGLFETERTRQVLKLCDRIESHVPHDEPLIIGGDFNDWRGRASAPLEQKLDVKEAFRSLHGQHARTFPSWLPAFRLDRIYFRGLLVEDAQCLNERPWNELSDHAALVAELAF
jgi:endonuclease/exonuclease/phosphatase family metal-dependent hydrolase